MNRLNTSTYTGGTVYLGKDVMGSVRGISNEYGLLEDRYEYDAFGKPYKGDLNNGMNLGYTGKPYDTTTGMYNYGYRDYQPEVARFTTVDPIRDGANWFAYVNNDPVNWVDLWGLECTGSDKKSSSRINTDTLAKGIYDTAAGGLKVILGAGIIAGGGSIIGGVMTVDGWVQASVGLAEIAAGLTNASANTPNSMSEILGIVGDAVKNAATGDNSTTLQDLGKWVGSQPVGIFDQFFLNPSPLD